MTTERQLAPAVLMVRPASFFGNPETAASNRFQQGSDLSARELQRLARQEFDALAENLSDAGVRVVIEDDTPLPETPDAVFPNNWISTHADGTVVLYPMEAVSRRAERRADIVDSLASRHGFRVSRVLDLSNHEKNGQFLEGTGSLVLDRSNHLAYACRSSRTSETVLHEWTKALEYEAIVFDAVDQSGTPIYHTNVMMCIGENLAVVCLHAIANDEQRNKVLNSLESTGREVVDISMEQMQGFAGNMLQLGGTDGAVLAMSAAAEKVLDEDQRRALSSCPTIISSPIGTIEKCSGGSVRCMLAEIHLPSMD